MDHSKLSPWQQGFQISRPEYDGNKTVSWADVGWQPKEVKRAPIGTIKLSEAIRIGARIRPKCEVALHMDGKSCALGAAYEAVTGSICGAAEYSKVEGVFPQLLDQKLLGAITDRNDGIGDHGEMTRESIADWLESQGY